VGPARQRGHGPTDLHRGMVIPSGDFRPCVDQAPLGRPRRVPMDRRRIPTHQFPGLGPRRQPRLHLRAKDRWRLGLGLQVAVAPLAHALPALCAAKPRVDKGPDPCRGPHPHGVARGPGTMAASGLDLRPWRVSESSRPSRGCFARKPCQPRGVKGLDPAPKGLLLPIPPRRDLGAALAIQQHTVVALAQPDIRRAAKGVPYLIPCDRRVRHLHQLQTRPLLTWRSVIEICVDNRKLLTYVG
jgi:hypothetical protein